MIYDDFPLKHCDCPWRTVNLPGKIWDTVGVCQASKHFTKIWGWWGGCQFLCFSHIRAEFGHNHKFRLLFQSHPKWASGNLVEVCSALHLLLPEARLYGVAPHGGSVWLGQCLVLWGKVPNDASEFCGSRPSSFFPSFLWWPQLAFVWWIETTVTQVGMAITSKLRTCLFSELVGACNIY